MKIFKSLIFLTTAVVIIFSCQKELSYNNGGVSTGTFVKDIYGNCSPATVTGVFTKDSVLTNTNFVDIQVNATIPGTFNIVSDTLNGFWFSKTGSVVMGNNTIRLYPSGKPVASGTSNFTITYGSSKCVFSITVVGPGAAPAVFTLGTTASACTGAQVNGTLTKDTALTASNTITVNVNVTTVGTYSITGTTTNGFSYSSTGIFTTTGNQTVTLIGTGKPTAAGNTVVTITNVTTTCTISVTVAGPTGGTVAAFTLDGAPNGCTNYSVAGTYTVGVITNTSNTVTLHVTVQTAGTYTIATNTVNGISFAASGTLATGTQTIVLTATGTPTAAGTFTTYKPNVTASCNFSVTTVAQPNTDYFPLSQNSWWSWTVVGYTDTAYSIIYGTKSYNSNTYTEMQDSYAAKIVDTAHYRKSVNDYYEWSPTDYFSIFLQFDSTLPKTYADINFLKENSTNNFSWSSQSFTGVFDVAVGASGTVTYNFKIINTDTSITLNTINYPHVIHVANAVNWNIPAYAINGITENDDYYYAKGVGIIKVIYTPTILLTPYGATTVEYNIKNYTVY